MDFSSEPSPKLYTASLLGTGASHPRKIGITMNADTQVHPSVSPTSALEHSRFYFTDETVVLRVGKRLYKVHRYFLQRDSEVFRDMFSCPPGQGGREGESDETAIPLPGVTTFEMDCLLQFLYFGMYERQTDFLDALKALLSITTRFIFQRIREVVIKEIDAHPVGLDPIEKIVLAGKYDIPNWLPPAYTALCIREEALRADEAEQLGMDVVVKLAKAREVILKERIPYVGLRCTKREGGVPLCKCCAQVNHVREMMEDENARAKRAMAAIFFPGAATWFTMG